MLFDLFAHDHEDVLFELQQSVGHVTLIDENAAIWPTVWVTIPRYQLLSLRSEFLFEVIEKAILVNYFCKSVYLALIVVKHKVEF